MNRSSNGAVVPPQRDREARRPRSAKRGWLAPGMVLLLGLALVVLLSRGLLGNGHPRNLLLITLDTTRADALGAYGNAQARTPVLDQLAREGVRIRRCITCTPLTLPAHSTILTGTYPFVHGVRRNGFESLPASSETLTEHLKRLGFRTEAITGSVVLRSRFGLEQGFDRYVDVDPKGAVNPAAAERKGDLVTNEAIAALQRIGRERFFLWVHYYDPHYPYESSRVSDPLSPEAYADEIAFMDEQVGRLLSEVRRLGLERSTLVVAVGDHGEGLMDHGESEHGYFVYETTLRVPLLLRAPGVLPTGRIVEPPVRTIDLVPTLLDYLAAPPSDQAQGRSLRPLIEGRDADTESAAYSEAHAPQEVLGLGALRSLSRGGWKYIHASPPELYNLATDPEETTNLADRESERVRAMRGELQQLLATAPTRSPEAAPPALSPQEAELFRSLGYVGGDPETGRADPILEEVFEPTGKNPSSCLEAVEAYARSHRFTAVRAWGEAEAALREALLGLPEAPHALRDLELALRRQNRETELLPFCASLLERHPDASALRIRYARRLAQSDQREESFRQVREAARRSPEDSEVLVEYAQVLWAQDQVDQAVTPLKRARELAPRNPRVYYWLARVAIKQDSLETAEKYLRQAVELDPQSPVLQRELERVLNLRQP